MAGEADDVLDQLRRVLRETGYAVLVADEEAEAQSADRPSLESLAVLVDALGQGVAPAMRATAEAHRILADVPGLTPDDPEFFGVYTTGSAEPPEEPRIILDADATEARSLEADAETLERLAAELLEESDAD
jgi:hypothetical protein